MGGIEGMDDNIYGVPNEHNKWFKMDIATKRYLWLVTIYPNMEINNILVVLLVKIVIFTPFNTMRI